MNFKQLAAKMNSNERIAPGHRTCSGCGIPAIVRTVLASTDDPVVACSATGCWEVTSSIYPFTSWNIPFIHSAFENSAATGSGIEAAKKVLAKKGKCPENVNVLAMGGDGGTYDFGLQSLSGALERGHKMVYLLYDNEAYMNTGIQRSSSTPYGASTTTTPAGKVHPGKEEVKKDIIKIAAAHNIPYVAQASLSNLIDLSMKAEKAFKVDGPAFIVCLQPCTLGWAYPQEKTVELAKLAVETRLWPLYEIENGKYKLNYKPSKNVPITDYLKLQGRYKHLFKPENQHIIETIQKNIDSKWEELLKLSGQ